MQANQPPSFSLAVWQMFEVTFKAIVQICSGPMAEGMFSEAQGEQRINCVSKSHFALPVWSPARSLFTLQERELGVSLSWTPRLCGQAGYFVEFNQNI